MFRWKHDDTPASSAWGSRTFGMAVVSVLIAIFVVSMSASAFPAGVDLARAFINVFMTAVFGAGLLVDLPLREAPGPQVRWQREESGQRPGQPALIGMWQTGETGRPWSPVFMAGSGEPEAKSFSFAVRMCIIV